MRLCRHNERHWQRDDEDQAAKYEPGQWFVSARFGNGARDSPEDDKPKKEEDAVGDHIIQVMGELEIIADEATAGMSKFQMLKTADEFEQLARIIRSRVCSACEVCRLPCLQQIAWRN